MIPFIVNSQFWQEFEREMMNILHAKKESGVGHAHPHVHTHEHSHPHKHPHTHPHEKVISIYEPDDKDLFYSVGLVALCTVKLLKMCGKSGEKYLTFFDNDLRLTPIGVANFFADLIEGIKEATTIEYFFTSARFFQEMKGVNLKTIDIANIVVDCFHMGLLNNFLMSKSGIIGTFIDGTNPCRIFEKAFGMTIENQSSEKIN